MTASEHREVALHFKTGPDPARHAAVDPPPAGPKHACHHNLESVSPSCPVHAHHKFAATEVLLAAGVALDSLARQDRNPVDPWKCGLRNQREAIPVGLPCPPCES